ncbi:RcnB family protein [Arenimonas alkanexedens]
MSNLKLATLALLLAGTTALPADAQNSRLAGAVREAHAEGQERERVADRGDRREDQREDRGERREDRREDRGERQEDRRENRGERQEQRRDWRADHRDNRRDWRQNQRLDGNEGPNDSRYDRRNDRRYDSRFDSRNDRRYDRRYDRRSDRRDYYARQSDRRWNGYNWHPQHRYRAPVRYVYPRGYNAYQWRVGHRLPRNYYERSYYVDYRAYSLPPPPYGYHWIRVDRDVVLVALASGLIRDVLYGLYY